MAADDLQTLLEKAEARQIFISQEESVKLFEEIATAQREELLKTASSNLAAAESIDELSKRRKALAETARQKAEMLQQLLGKQQRVMDKLSPQGLAREVETAAKELERQSDALAEQFCEEGSIAGAAAAGAGSPWEGGAGSSTPSPAGSASAANLREFRERYLALRKRYHSAQARAHILKTVGYLNPTAAAAVAAGVGL